LEQELFMPTLSHFENGNGWSGSLGEMCYQIEAPAEGTVKVVLWYGPFCRAYAQEVAETAFPVSKEGREEMIAWLKAQAEEMTAHPAFSREERRAYYLERYQKQYTEGG